MTPYSWLSLTGSILLLAFIGWMFYHHKAHQSGKRS